jgi:uncharacterized membrane protein
MTKRLILLLCLALVTAAPLAAQPQPVAYAVLLYSPTCPHCHDVINNDLPGIQDRFGNQLIILFVDVATQGGQMLAQSAYQHYAIPRDRWVVPMMIVDEQVLIGSVQIPTELPRIVEAGLARGGVDLPAFPGMRESYDQYLAQHPEQALVDVPAAPALAERLAADPLANGLAVAVLVGLALSLAAVLFIRPLPQRLARGALLVTLSVSLLLALTLVMQETVDVLATPLAWGNLILLALTAGLYFRRADQQLIPLVALAGLLNAAYLAYVELSQVEAVCGAVGNCNAVQQSPYAQLFGIPIGVIGLAGYAAVLLVWLLTRYAPVYRNVLAVLVIVGAAVSIYLTFLEPFVIGAVCAWCLLSAVLMLALLWLAAPVEAHQVPKQAAR